MRVIIFGVGNYYEKMKRYFRDDEIVALCDNNPGKIGTVKDGIEVLMPAVALEKTFDRIFVMCLKSHDVYLQLLEMGVDRSKISTVYDMPQFYRKEYPDDELKLYCLSDNFAKLLHRKKRRVAIMTYGMGVNGGDFVLTLLAEALRDDFEVHIISSVDGPLRKKFLSLGCVVVIDEYLLITALPESEWIKAYDFIFVNGAIFHSLFTGDLLALETPVVWWIHSSGIMNSEVMLQSLEGRTSQGRVSVYGVSKLVTVSFKELVPSWQIKELCYGIHDAGEPAKPVVERVVFALVGSVQPIKGQDLLLDAFEKLPKEYKQLSEIWFVGPAGETEYVRKIRERAGRMDSVKMLGVFTNDELQKVYKNISVLVCPSRVDAMPIVCAEAMMHCKPCIVSDAVGTAMYIHDKENGFVFASEHVDDLVKQMEWVIENRSALNIIGMRARDVYESKFIYDVFKKNIIKIVKDKITPTPC